MLYQIGVVILFPFVMSFAAVTDALSYKISNWVSGLLVAGFILLVPFSGMEIDQIWAHVGVAVLALFAGFFMFARGWIGGGDAKIIAAAMLWLGPELAAPFLLILGISGGVLSLIYLRIRNTPLPGWLAGQRWLLNWQTGPGGVPYGLAIGFAALILYPESYWLGLS